MCVGVGVGAGVGVWELACGCGRVDVCEWVCVGGGDVGVGIYTYIPTFSPGLLKNPPPPLLKLF